MRVSQERRYAHEKKLGYSSSIAIEQNTVRRVHYCVH
jgi:hypothetical protein